MEQPQQAVIVGSALYDPARGELRRTDGESALQIRPQSMRVLDLLVAQAGRLVTREAIHAAVWPSVVVTDDSLVQCIAEIRRAIGDTQHNIIRTVPRRGYRLEFVEPSRTAATHPEHSSRRPAPGAWLVVGAMILLVLAASAAWWWRGGDPSGSDRLAAPDVVRPPLAVMAFRAESTDTAMQALGAGWSEDLAATLARDTDLRLVATRSSFAVSPSASPIAAAKELGVRYLVEGKVHRVGEALQVTALLIDGRDGAIVWTERLDLTKDNFGTERDGLIRKVAASVQASMRWREKELARQLPDSIDAHVLTLRAYGHKHRYTPEAYRAARGDQEEALRLSPGHAAAWAGLGYLNGIDAINRITGQWTPQHLPTALEQIDRAVALDPTLSVAFQGRAIVLAALKRHGESLAAAQEAVRIAPGDPDNLVVLAKSLVEADRVDDGLANLRRARVLYPIEPVYVSFMAAHVFWAGALHDEAIAAARRCVERAPRFTNCHITLASALLESNRIEEARREAYEIRALMPTATTAEFSTLFDGVPRLRNRRIFVAETLGFPRDP